MPTPILIIDNIRLWRDVLSNTLTSNQEFIVIGVAGSEVEAIRRLSEVDTDLGNYSGEPIILLDNCMDSGTMVRHDGIRIARRLAGINSKLKFIMITAFGDAHSFQDVYISGLFSGYLRKDPLSDDPALLVRTLHEVRNGRESFQVPNTWFENIQFGDNFTQICKRQLKQIYFNNLEEKERKKLNILSAPEIKITDKDLLEFCRIEKIRTFELGLSVEQWRLFMSVAKGESKRDYICDLYPESIPDNDGDQIYRKASQTYDVQLMKIRSKMGFEENKNQALLLIQALKYKIPEIIDYLNGRCNLRIVID